MRGEIYSLEAYARGKVLEHSEWAGVLPRKITPSDIDMVFDNNGKFLFCELNSQFADFESLDVGQYRLYRNLVLMGQGNVTAALLHHATPEPGVKIRTMSDVLSFQLMRFREDRVAVSKVYEGALWRKYVEKFFGKRV